MCRSSKLGARSTSFVVGELPLQYFLYKDGEQTGPYTREQLTAELKSGRVVLRSRVVWTIKKLGTRIHYTAISCLPSMPRRIVVENRESSAQYGNNYYRPGHFARPVLCGAYFANLGLDIDLGISTALALPRLRQNLSGVNGDVHPRNARSEVEPLFRSAVNE